MNRLHIDFAPFSLRRELFRVHPILRWSIVAAMLFSVLAGFRIQRLFSRLESLDRETASLASRSRTDARQTKETTGVAIDAKQGAAVNAAVARLNLPWGEIFDSLEAATPEQVSLLSIRPEPRSAQLRIEAQGNRSDDMIAYMKALERQPSVERVYLTKHEHVHDGFVEAIRFQIEVQWRRAGL